MIIALIISLLLFSISSREIKKNSAPYPFNITKAGPYSLLGFIFGGVASIFLILLIIIDFI